MSLKDLRAQSEEEEVAVEPEVEEDQEVTEPVEAEEDAEIDEEAEETQDEGEPSDDFELELDGESDPDQQKHSPKDAIYHKMRKEKAKRQEAQSEVDRLKDEIEQMKAQLAGGQHKPAPSQPQSNHPNYPPVPVLYESGINTPQAYNEAYQKWMGEVRRIDSEADQKRRQQSDFERQQDERKLRMAERAEKFLTENKVSVGRFSTALDRAVSEMDAAAGLEGSAIYLLDKIGDRSERVAFYLGSNEAALNKVKALLSKEPDGLAAMHALSSMAERLKPKNGKSISKAPPPDEALKGDGSPKSSRKLQDAFDKASDERNMKKMKELKRRAEQLGVRLK